MKRVTRYKRYQIIRFFFFFLTNYVVTRSLNIILVFR